ncbi:Putative protein-S-isoprenylcysteine methyltransferase [hydrothermal vent metagenome]|uniref:Isoprenylcysteine carboxylmethyltransferase family protein n=1 Tax=hydrothermal vent metagenome TaxID=652676 RepID=A0A3B1A2P3_9ZZZZ
MKLKIPPPLVGLFLGFLMWSFAKQISFGSIEFELSGMLSLIIVFAGLAIDIAAVIPFLRAKTTINPMKPNRASKLVNTGIYKYSRNPMYLGTLVLLTALTLWLGNAINVVFLGAFVWYITIFQIKPEEDVLEKLFSDEYLRYKMEVRRWI